MDLSAISNVLELLRQPGIDDLVQRGPAPEAEPLPTQWSTPALELLATNGGTSPSPASPSRATPTSTPLPELPMASPMPAPTPLKPHQKRDLGGMLRQIAPMLVSTIISRRDPAAAGALLSGWASGSDAALKERLDADQVGREQTKMRAAYMETVAAHASQFEDPTEHAQYLQQAERIGASIGLPSGWTASIAFPKSKLASKLQKDAQTRLDGLEKDPAWKTIVGTPDETKFSVQLSDGTRHSIAELRTLAGRQLFDASGQAAMPPARPVTPEKGPPTDYARFLDRWAKDHGKTLETLTSADELAAKKAYGQADDRPLKGTDPILEQIRALTLANLKRSSDGELAPAQATAGGKLADDYRAESKDFIQVSQAYNRVRASAKDPSAAGDLALIFNYMKTLDPGSTVREGEFATAQNSGGVDDKIRVLYNRVTSGERLSPAMRADFLDRSRRLYTQALGQQRRIEDQYKRRAKAINVPGDFVVTDYSVADEGGAPAAPSAPPKPKGQNVKWSKSQHAWVEVTGTTPDGKPIVRVIK